MTLDIARLNPYDIYRIQNKRKKTYKNMGYICRDILTKEKDGQINTTLFLTNLSKIYNTDYRTLKRYFGDFIHRIGNEKNYLLLDDTDLLVIDECIQTIRKYQFLSKKHQKLCKYIAYDLLTI